MPHKLARTGRPRQSTHDAIVAAAWALARRDGIAALSLRDLAAAVGIRAPSLYSYFASKHDLYDALFADGYRAFNARMAAVEAARLPRTGAHTAIADAARAFMAFCREDVPRYQLLFTPAVPGFAPSDASMALAADALAFVRRNLAAFGIDDPAADDLLIALLTGLVNQQIANDPVGDRWERLIDRAAAMFLADVAGSGVGGVL